MKRRVIVLFCAIVISGCASTTTDTLADEKRFVKICTNTCFSGSVVEYFKKEGLMDEAKKFKKSCESGCKERSTEYYKEINERRERVGRSTYHLDHQPSYDPNYQIRRLEDDLTIQSIIQNGKIKEMEKEMQRSETQRLQRESMERVQEQRRQIEQGILEDNRKREMHKLRQDLLYRGIY